MPRARLATNADVGPLGAALARSFSTDPVWRWIVPDEQRWEQRAPAVFGHEVGGRLRLGHSYTTDDRAGAALWAPPGRWRSSGLDLLRSALPMARLARGGGARRGLAVLRATERVHPKAEHWYLALLGTHPHHQGRGVASAVLAPVLERCDLDGVGAYLESSNPVNVAFYQRHGFRVMGEVAPGGSPPLALMWRDPDPVEGEER
jgi:ribosomal protein S18 acetylase RimI-like enzyme